MTFDQFLNHTTKIANAILPAEAAHVLMAPPERAALIRSLDLNAVNPRRAAVLMLVYPNLGQACLALIKRNSYKGVHSSQIAFPGGKVEEDDAGHLYTALRETEEEIGVPREHVQQVCAFSEVYIPPSNFCVSPFLGFVESKPLFIPDPREVAGMIEYPLKDLLDPGNLVMTKMATSYSESISVPSFRVGETVIWGATAMMLSELKEVLKNVL